MSLVSGHMLPSSEAVGQKLGQCDRLKALVVYQIDAEIVSAELPHDLTADAAGWEGTGDDAALSAADGDGGKVPVSVIDGLEKCRPLGAVGGAVGSVFDVAALIDASVGTQQRRAHLKAGVGRVGVAHSLNCKIT